MDTVTVQTDRGAYDVLVQPVTLNEAFTHRNRDTGRFVALVKVPTEDLIGATEEDFAEEELPQFPRLNRRLHADVHSGSVQSYELVGVCEDGEVVVRISGNVVETLFGYLLFEGALRDSLLQGLSVQQVQAAADQRRPVRHLRSI